MVNGLTFRSLIHFEFIFVYGVRECFLPFLLCRKELTIAGLRLLSLEKPAFKFRPWLTSGNMAFETFPK